MIDGVTNPVQVATQATPRSEAPSGQATCLREERLDQQADAVELSETAQGRIERDEAAPVRTELVERVRAEIAAGTYLTDGKLSVAAERLCADLTSVA